MDTTYRDVAITEDLNQIEGLYTIKGRAEVLSFLQAHSALVPLLLEAASRLQTYFPDARLSLERIGDPEEPREQVFVGVASGLPVDQAIDRLRQFDHGWWLENGPRGQRKLGIDVVG
jgi:hypothetical protein